MTISSSRGVELSIDDLILTAYQQCGVMSVNEGAASPQWSERVLFARRRLDAIIDEIPTSGGMARSVEFYNLTLTSGTYKYDLPSYALNLEGNGMYINASEVDISKASGETFIKHIGRDNWHLISAKSSEGLPSVMYCHRATSPLQVWFWPIPNEAGTARIQIYRLSSDTYEGEKNIDLMSYWTEYITYRLSYAIAMANNLPIETCRLLRDEARILLTRAKMYSSDHTGSQIHVSHGKGG